MFKISYKRHGESRQVTSRNEMPLSAAMKKVAEEYGLGDHCVSQDYIDANLLVVVLQDWLPDGTDQAVYLRTRGKYRGTTCGFSTRKRISD